MMKTMIPSVQTMLRSYKNCKAESNGYIAMVFDSPPMTSGSIVQEPIKTPYILVAMTHTLSVGSATQVAKEVSMLVNSTAMIGISTT